MIGSQRSLLRHDATFAPPNAGSRQVGSVRASGTLGPEAGWAEGTGMCGRAFKCGELGCGRRCGVLPILHARQGAGRGHGVLTMRGGAGSGGRREKALGSHVLGTNFRGFTTGEIGSRPWALLTPCRVREKRDPNCDQRQESGVRRQHQQASARAAAQTLADLRRRTRPVRPASDALCPRKVGVSAEQNGASVLRVSTASVYRRRTMSQTLDKH